MQKTVLTFLAAFILSFIISVLSLVSANSPVVLDFAEYHNGTVNKQDTATVENTELDGRTAVKITPNQKSKDSDVLKIDAYSFGNLGIDVGEYKWLVVEYKYVTDSPCERDMIAHIKTNGGILKDKYLQSAKTVAVTKMKCNEWDYLVFDFNFIEEMLAENLDVHTLRQMHFLPFANTKLATLPENDAIYIGHIVFMSEKPEIRVNYAYTDGYEDGTFRPSEFITKAQSCKMLAVSLEGDSDIHGNHPFNDVQDGKWYSDYIGYCYENGLISGSGNYCPDEYITKSEFAQMVYLSTLDANDRKNAVFTQRYESNTRISREDAVIMINRSRGMNGSMGIIGEEYTLAFFDVSKLQRSFEDVLFSRSETVSSGENVLFAVTKITDRLSDKISGQYFDTDNGNRYIKELDILEKQRIDEIRCTPDIGNFPGNVYYVSNHGDDSYDGTSSETPFLTLGKALSEASDGDTVLLERGCIFRGNFSVKNAITLSAYGTGDKPKIYGSPADGADASLWTLDYEDSEKGIKIWKYADESMRDVGNIVFNGGEKYAYKDIPSCTADGGYLVRGMESSGTVYDYITELDFDLNYFHRANSGLNASKGYIDIGTSSGPLYLRCDAGNPGDIFDSIEFSPRGNTVGIKSDNVTVDNICIMYAGSHGIGSGTRKNLTVTNCELGWIGGSIQHYNNAPNRVTRFGNGVEIYGGCDNYLVENCYIYQCYDAGITHQLDRSGGTDDQTMYNVTYRNNLITECVYSIEYFFNEITGVLRDGNNILFEGNIMRRCGYGFGSTRPNGNGQRHIRSNPYGNPFRNFVIRDNILDRSVCDLLRIQFSKDIYRPQISGNTYVVGVGNGLCTYGYGNGISYTADVSSVPTIKAVLGDIRAKVYFTDYVPYYSYNYTSYN